MKSSGHSSNTRHTPGKGHNLALSPHHHSRLTTCIMSQLITLPHLSGSIPHQFKPKLLFPQRSTHLALQDKITHILHLLRRLQQSPVSTLNHALCIVSSSFLILISSVLCHKGKVELIKANLFNLFIMLSIHSILSPK